MIPAIEAEIKKIRPAVVVSDDSLGKLPLKIIVPITDWKERYEIAPWMVKIDPDSNNGLTKISSADCFQLRSLSDQRFVKKIGITSEIFMVNLKLKWSIFVITDLMKHTNPWFYEMI